MELIQPTGSSDNMVKKGFPSPREQPNYISSDIGRSGGFNSKISLANENI